MAASIYSSSTEKPKVVAYLMDGMGPGLPLVDDQWSAFFASSIRSGYNLAPIDWYDDDTDGGDGGSGGGGEAAVGSSKALSLLLVGLGFGALIGLGCDRTRQRSFWRYWRGGGAAHGRREAAGGEGPSEKALRPVGAVTARWFQRMGPMDDEFSD